MTRDYPFDCWYVVATTDELDDRPLAQTLLGEPVVLYRVPAGQPVALADRCAHRGYPLSQGRLEGDRIVCGYHGMRFDPSGQCVEVPSQPHVPYSACVMAYPVQEVPPFVWIWLGDPRRSTLVTPPTLPWLTSPSWASSGTTLTVAANFMLIHEHYLDLTHIPEVHPLETPPDLEQVPPLDQIHVSETSARYTRALPPADLADWEAEATGLPRGRPYSRRHHGTFLSPAVLVEGWEIKADDDQRYDHVRIQAVTPETPDTTHLFWRFGRSYALDRVIVHEHLQRVFEQVMRKDMRVIETIQATVGYERAASGVRVSADAGALRVRRIVEDMVARENGQSARSHLAAARRPRRARQAQERMSDAH